MLGKPASSETNPIPVLNLSPNLLSGEKWKEMEGFNGVYFISNFGRIKSVSRLSGGKISVWSRVGKGIAAQASHGTVRDSLPSYGSCYLIFVYSNFQ